MACSSCGQKYSRPAGASQSNGAAPVVRVGGRYRISRKVTTPVQPTAPVVVEKK